jgi:hypothetical protein
MNTNFLIISSSNIPDIDWNDAKPTTINGINKSLNKDLSIVSWTGSISPLPTSLNSLSYKEGPYTYKEISNVLTGSLWK